MKDIIDPMQKHSQRIDQVLRQLGSATPVAGIEDRIAARLARAEAEPSRLRRYFGLPRFAFVTAAGALACAAIVVSSVSHSHRILPTVPGIQLPAGASSGLGAASAAHMATKPVAPSPNERPRSMRKTVNGRAVITPEAQRPAGVAVPRNPAQQ
jgi:hypothetical protein